MKSNACEYANMSFVVIYKKVMCITREKRSEWDSNPRAQVNGQTDFESVSLWPLRYRSKKQQEIYNIF